MCHLLALTERITWMRQMTRRHPFLNSSKVYFITDYCGYKQKLPDSFAERIPYRNKTKMSTVYAFLIGHRQMDRQADGHT